MLDPARAAGGEHRKLRAGLDFLQELGALFHDREVGGEVGVVNHVEAQPSERGDQLAGNRLISRHTELLCQTDTDAGCVLNHNPLVRVVEHIPHFGDLAVDGDGTGRANRSTLAASDAAGFAEHLAEARGNNRSLAALGEINGADILDFRTHADAEAAQNALGRIAGNAGGGNIQREPGIGVFSKARFHHIVAMGILLQFAAAALVAGQALRTMAAHQELQRGVAALQNLLGVGVDNHAVAGLHGAGRIHRTAVVFHQA